jgi:hypothetical protein
VEEEEDSAPDGPRPGYARAQQEGDEQQRSHGVEDHVDYVVTQHLIPEGLPGQRVQQQVHGVVVHDGGRGVAQRLEQGEDGLEAQLVDEGVDRHVVEVVRDEGAAERRLVDRERRPEKGDE